MPGKACKKERTHVRMTDSVLQTDPPFRFPEQLELYRLWSRKRGNRRMPERTDLTAAELRSWLGYLNLIEVIDDGHDFKYLIHGTELGRYYNTEMTGRLVSSWPPAMRDAALETYRRVVQDRCPYLVAQDESAQDRVFAHHRIVLPFSRDGEKVDFILTYVHLSSTPEGRSGARYHPLAIEPQS